MTQITADMIKELRERTGVGMGKCKEALQEANGDMQQAIANLRKAGMATAIKKEGREANEGVIKFYEDNQSIALIEINAETDFVVKNDSFQKFADNLAEEVCKTKPASLEDFVGQKYSKDPHLSIDEYRATIIQSLGENIQIKRFEVFTKKNDASLAVYSHAGGKLVTLVEISGSNEEASLAKDVAMHVAAEAPEYLSSEEVPQRVIDHEREIASAQIKNKPDHILEKILVGKLQSYFDQVCLLNQRFIKNPDQTILQVVEERGKQNGKSLKVTYFLRWRVGN